MRDNRGGQTGINLFREAGPWSTNYPSDFIDIDIFGHNLSISKENQSTEVLAVVDFIDYSICYLAHK